MSDAALLLGIAAVGLASQAAGLETGHLLIALAVVCAGVFVGVGLGKVLRR